MNALVTCLMLPFFAGLITLAFNQNHERQKNLSLVLSFLTLLASIWQVVAVSELGIAVVQAGNWAAPFGITLAVDFLSAPIIVLVCLLGFVTEVFNLGYQGQDSKNPFYLPIKHFLVGGVVGAMITGDFFNLYVFFEIFLMASFALIAQSKSIPALMGGVKYTLLNLLGSVFFLAGLGFLYNQFGTLNMAQVASVLATEAFLFDFINNPGLTLPVLFFVIAFLAKAASFPLYSWLPTSYPNVSYSTTALLGGLLTKVGVYVLLRCKHLGLLSLIPDYTFLFQVIGMLTMVIGVFGAATQSHFSRILSVHIVSQVGYMIACVGIPGDMAIPAAVLFLAHNMIVKTNLFLIGGVVERSFSTSNLSQLGSGMRLGNVLVFLFALSAFSLVGIPPLSGFWGKFAIVKAALSMNLVFLTAVALFTGVFTLYSMIKIWSEVFLKEQTPDFEKAFPFSELNLRNKVYMYGAVAALGLLIMVPSLVPDSIARVVSAIGTQTQSSAFYVAAILGILPSQTGGLPL